MEAAKQVHNIPPLYDEDSRILVLGSFPSIASREAAFFYGHPQNRYWKVMPALLGEPLPETVEEKAAMMHKHHIAMWDTIGSCTITGSSDSSITDVVPNDLSVILETAHIEAIFTNGAKSTDPRARPTPRSLWSASVRTGAMHWRRTYHFWKFWKRRTDNEISSEHHQLLGLQHR